MAKNKKRKTIHQKDFITAKKKIGKRLNNNSTEKKGITVKPIRLITQKALLRADSSNQCLTSKKLSLNELIAQTSHHNDHIRHDALKGLIELFDKFSEQLYPQIGYIIASISKLIIDSDRNVRRCYRLLLKLLLNKLQERDSCSTLNFKNKSTRESQRLEPFILQLGLQLRSCITHKDSAIRTETLSLMEILASSSAVNSDFLRQIIVSSYADSSIFRYSRSRELDFLILIDFASDLLERCSYQTFDFRQLLDVYVINRILLNMLGFEEPGSFISFQKNMVPYTPVTSPMSLSAWIQKFTGTFQDAECSLNCISSAVAILHRFYNNLLTILEVLKNGIVTPCTDVFDKITLKKKNVNAFAFRAIKDMLRSINVYQDFNSLNEEKHFRSTMEYSEEVLVFFLPHALTRDLLFTFTQLFRKINFTNFFEFTFDASSKQEKFSQNSHIPNTNSIKGGITANHIIKRFISSIFLEYGIRNIAKADSTSVASRTLFILNHQIRLITTELCIWFYDKYFSSVHLSYSMVLTSLYIFSYNVQSFSADAKTTLQCPYLHGQFLSTFLSYAHLLCHQLNSESSLINQCVITVQRHLKDNPEAYLNCAQKSFKKLIDNLNSSVKSKKHIIALNILTDTYTDEDCLAWQTDETIIHLKTIYDEFTSSFSTFHHSPVNFFQTNLHSLIVSLWDTCVNVLILSLQNCEELSIHKFVSPLNSMQLRTELKDTINHCHAKKKIIDNTEVEAEDPNNKHQTGNPMVGITLSISAVICSLMNDSIDLNIDENVVQSSYYVPSTLESLKYLKQLNGNYKMQVEAFQIFLLESDKILKIYSNWFVLLDNTACCSSSFFHHLFMLLIYVKCFTGFADAHQMNETYDRLIKDISKQMSDMLRDFFFHIRTPDTHPIIYSTGSDVQKLVFYIWNALNFLILDKNEYAQEYLSLWSPLLDTLNMKQLSDDIVMCINDMLAYNQISSENLKQTTIIKNV